MNKSTSSQPEFRRHAQDSNKSRRVPSLRTHKASGQAYVVLSGKAIYCGKPQTPAAEQRYHQALAEWMAAGRQLPAHPDSITVKELLARFWLHAEQYYRTETDGRNKELEQFRLALRPVNQLYGETPAIDFGPRSLKAVRQTMVEKSWSRLYINKQVNRIRHVFKWGVSDELIPSSMLIGLQSVAGLKRGRSDAPDLEAVKPVATEAVDAIKPFVSRQVWAMIQMQLFTGARAGEIARMRPCDIDRGDEKLTPDKSVWIYQPKEHKTAWHGHERKIYIGPRAQQVLTPFLLRDPQTFCFSPAEAETERRERLHDERITPLSCGNIPGSNRRRKPKWTVGERYTSDSYRRAIARACDEAFPAPEPLAKREDETIAEWEARLTPEQKAELAAWQKAHRWHPHQLRHNAATELRKEFGIEAARIILGHRSAAITEVYAEQDERQAIEAIMKVG